MSCLHRLEFNLWYLFRPPWESGIVPPEVLEAIMNTPAGKVLDLGCGSGTSSLALASAGWDVTGVDFVVRAIRIARKKAKRENLRVDFRVGDVTRLPAFPDHFTLVLDIGCFHGLSPSGKKSYLHQLKNVMAPKGTWMMYGFFKPESSAGPGLVPEDIAHTTKNLALVKRQDGWDMKERPSAWFWFRKMGAEEKKSADLKPLKIIPSAIDSDR